MELNQALAEAKLTDMAYHMQLSKIDDLPAIVTIGSEAIDVSGRREKLIGLLNKIPVGTHIELLALYIQQNWNRFSPEVQETCKALALTAPTEKTTRFSKDDQLKQLFEEVNSHRISGADCIIGSTLVTNTAITKAEVMTAAAIAVGAHPLRAHLNHTLKTYKSINALDLLEPEAFLGLIDFPITSVRNLLRCMAYSYIDGTSYVADGILVGTTREFVVVYAKANPKFYKVMKLETFRAIYHANVFDGPLTKKTSTSYGILEYSNGGQAHA